VSSTPSAFAIFFRRLEKYERIQLEMVRDPLHGFEGEVPFTTFETAQLGAVYAK
jgi:hypothetical protein